MASLLAGCSHLTSQEERIEEYVRAHANDPASYEPISFGVPKPCRLMDLPGANTKDTTVIGVVIEHEYRAKNRLGALTRETGYFVVSALNQDVLAIGPEGKGY